MTRCDEYDIDEKRMLAAWMTSRRDEYDINEDGGEAAGGGMDDSKYDMVRRSTSFVNCQRSTHRDSGKLYNMTRRDEYDIDEKRMPATWMTSRRDEYDVDEKRMPAAWMTSSKTRQVRY